MRQLTTEQEHCAGSRPPARVVPAKRGSLRGRLAGECHRDASADQDDEEDPSPRPRRQAAGADLEIGHPRRLLVLLALGAVRCAPEVRRRVGVAEGLQVATDSLNHPRNAVNPSLLSEGLGGGLLLLGGHHRATPPWILRPRFPTIDTRLAYLSCGNQSVSSNFNTKQKAQFVNRSKKLCFYFLIRLSMANPVFSMKFFYLFFFEFFFFFFTPLP